MHKLLLLSCIFIFFGCNGKGKPVAEVKKISAISYPRFVHDTCTGVWAVMPFEDLFFGTPYKWRDGGLFQQAPALMKTYWNKHGYGTLPEDSFHTFIGYELQFTDSITAVKTFTLAYARQLHVNHISDSIARAKADNEDAERKRKDSIFKCNHTYDIK